MTADTEDGGNVYQRLVRIAAEVGKVAATGKTQHGSEAMSVDDIEGVIRERLAAEGLITRWSTDEVVDIGNGKLWLTRLTVRVVNGDNPEDFFQDQWADIGSTPSAAASYTVKGYYRRLFHLARDKDEDAPRGNTAPREQHSTFSAPPRPKERREAVAAGQTALRSATENLLNDVARLSNMSFERVEQEVIARAYKTMGSPYRGEKLERLAEDALAVAHDEAIKALDKLTGGKKA